MAKARCRHKPDSVWPVGCRVAENCYVTVFWCGGCGAIGARRGDKPIRWVHPHKAEAATRRALKAAGL